MPTILEQIVEQTAADLKKRMRRVSFRDFESMECYETERRSYAGALSDREEPAIIAEIKKASPSKGEIRPDFDPESIARQYREGGAAALSVLTDEPAFLGKLEYLEIASKTVDLPVLRKDFIIEPYQVKEARAYGADAVLLIVTITEGNQLGELLAAVEEFGLEALVEIYSEEDLKRVNFNEVNILGANNRDLHTFEVDLHRGIDLLRQAPEQTLLVSESGLNSPEDLKQLHDNDIDAALIGEFFMKQPDPGVAVRELLEAFRNLTGLEEEETEL